MYQRRSTLSRLVSTVGLPTRWSWAEAYPKKLSIHRWVLVNGGGLNGSKQHSGRIRLALNPRLTSVLLPGVE